MPYVNCGTHISIPGGQCEIDARRCEERGFKFDPE